MIAAPSAHAAFSCGAGYIMEKAGNTDGIPTYECKKLWCMDLENGKTMGKNNSANSGYRATSQPVRLCDKNNSNCIECFGERKWCGGEVPGEWNPEYGAYTRGGDNNATYKSYQRGSCFAWRLEKPNCADGKTAMLVDGKWECVTSTGTDVGSRESSIRRTGTLRRGRM